jgi:hypothetical protein
MKREILLFVDNKEQILTGSCFEEIFLTHTSWHWLQTSLGGIKFNLMSVCLSVRPAFGFYSVT